MLNHDSWTDCVTAVAERCSGGQLGGLPLPLLIVRMDRGELWKREVLGGAQLFPRGTEKARGMKLLWLLAEMGWALDNGQVTYRAFDLTPGAWDFFSLTCGSITFDAPIGSPGYSQAGTRYNALARFFISPREVLYLGDLTMVQEPPFARFSTEIRTDVARKELSRHQPDLGKAMITRPLFRNPG